MQLKQTGEHVNRALESRNQRVGQLELVWTQMTYGGKFNDLRNEIFRVLDWTWARDKFNYLKRQK